MSPLERPRHIHRLPGQQPRVERKIFPVGFVPNSWPQMNEVITEQFRDNPDTLAFYKANKRFYINFFNARSDIAQHRGSERFNRFVARYATEGSRFYKPERFSDENRPILDRINLSLFPNRIHGRK
nr:hypothetical protein [Candidatus Levybacteria bacterium]